MLWKTTKYALKLFFIINDIYATFLWFEIIETVLEYWPLIKLNARLLTKLNNMFKINLKCIFYLENCTILYIYKTHFIMFSNVNLRQLFESKFLQFENLYSTSKEENNVYLKNIRLLLIRSLGYPSMSLF